MKSGRSGGLREHRSALDGLGAEVPPVVTIWGDSDFLRNEALSHLTGLWLSRHPHGDVVSVRSDDSRAATLSGIAGELAGASLFAREKLLVIRQAERSLFAARSGQDNDAAAGMDGLTAFLASPSPATWLCVESKTLPRNRSIGKKLAEAGYSIPCPEPMAREVPQWLADRAKKLGTSLEPEAADMLIRAHGTDLGKLASEVEKLTLLDDAVSVISADMVAQFLTGTVEFDIFAFTNAIEAADARGAAYYARKITRQGMRDQRGKLEDGERSAHRALSMLAGTVQGLLKAKLAEVSGLDAAAFARSESLSPWRAQRLMDAAGRFSLREVRLMLGAAAEELRRTHDTGGDAGLALETLAVRFGGRMVGREV